MSKVSTGKKIVASIESLKTMGTWKKRIFDRKGKRSATTSKPARIYIAIPPIEGWPGGDPLKNGYRPSGGK